MTIGPNGSAVVDPDKCTDCGACMKACPRKLIVEVPASAKVHVACANLDKGKAAMSVCSSSCIGCGLCQKECRKDAIHVENGVAVILKNNVPRYVLVEYSQVENEQTAEDEDVLAVSRRLIAKNHRAYEKLAK